MTIKIGIQLYTVRDHTKGDMLSTLDALAAFGYEYIETAGYGNATAKEVRSTLDRTGMQAISSHVSFQRLTHELDAVTDEMLTLGCQWVVIPRLAPEYRSPTGITAASALMNEWSHRFAEAGLSFGYHNHEFEFEVIDSSTMFDRIRDETAEANLSLEIDLGWALYAGADPVSLIRENAGRVPLLHGKDLSADRGSATTGTGILPWPEIVQAARESSVEFLIVENDQPVDSLTDAEAAIGNLEKLLAL
ncbi:sugar phosphate isomerase/epimerase [soil metagenome]